MRILAMTNLYPNPYQPHRATFVRHQLRILGERHPVRVIAPIAWTDEVRLRSRKTIELPRDRQIQRDGLTIDHPRYLFPPKLLRGWYGHCYRACVGRTFRRVIREFRPDLVFTPWAYPDGWAAIRLGKSAGLPVVLQVHGSDILLVDQFPGRQKRTVEAVRGADGIVAVSHDLANRLAGMGVESSRVRVIHDGVDRTLFFPGDRASARAALKLPPDESLLLFVGNLVPVKAVDVLLRAVGDQPLKAEGCRLQILGEGAQRAALEALTCQLGLADRVVFRGAVHQAELPLWYRAADVFVLPSHSEGIPNVLLEASACGTPWVASRVGGIPEIAHLGVSRLVTPNSPGELAKAIQETLAARDIVLPLGPKPREDAVSELEEWLETVTNSFGRHAMLSSTIP